MARIPERSLGLYFVALGFSSSESPQNCHPTEFRNSQYCNRIFIRRRQFKEYLESYLHKY